MITKIKTREEWLAKSIEILKKELFLPRKHNVPKNVKVSCGFPHMRAFSSRNPRIGECWYPQTNAKGTTTHQIFISPVLHDPLRVLDVLTHEVVHTIAGPGAGHKAPFKSVAVDVGLEGKMTATVAGEELTAFLTKVKRRLGNYPHDPLSKLTTTHKKDGIRQLKAMCQTCGYTIRLSRKWIDELGLPRCPGCNKFLEEA
jgi:hypothetical protein